MQTFESLIHRQEAKITTETVGFEILHSHCIAADTKSEDVVGWNMLLEICCPMLQHKTWSVRADSSGSTSSKCFLFSFPSLSLCFEFF